jgi:hypothetical protein
MQDKTDDVVIALRELEMQPSAGSCLWHRRACPSAWRRATNRWTLRSRAIPDDYRRFLRLSMLFMQKQRDWLILLVLGRVRRQARMRLESVNER